jgi:hypothetical protein
VDRGGRGAPAQVPLFELAELRLERTGIALLAEVARSPLRAPTRSERKTSEERAVLDRLRTQAGELARAFQLRFANIEKERDGVNEHYGVCYSDGTIRIRLRHARTGRLLKESSLVDTLCHELAHLRHFDHSPRFRAFYLRILSAARERGYYRPGPEAQPRLRQASLFDDAACGTAAR